MDALSRFWDRVCSFGFGRAHFVGSVALLGVLVCLAGVLSLFCAVCFFGGVGDM